MRTGSDRSSSKNLQSIELARTEEKVVIVPIFFTDGIPEPSKISLFNFAKSRRHAHRVNHFVKLDKKASSMSQNSVYSGRSVESSAIESSCLGQKLTNRNSGLSVSCVSRGGSSSLRCRNPSHVSNTTKTLSDYHHSRGRHSQSSKAHSESMRRVKKKVIQGMMSSPEEFLSDTWVQFPLIGIGRKNWMLASLSWMDVSLKDRDREAVSGILDIGRRPLQSRKRLRIPVFTFSWWERWFWLTRLVATYFIELGKKKKRKEKRTDRKKTHFWNRYSVVSYDYSLYAVYCR